VQRIVRPHQPPARVEPREQLRPRQQHLPRHRRVFTASAPRLVQRRERPRRPVDTAADRGATAAPDPPPSTPADRAAHPLKQREPLHPLRERAVNRHATAPPSSDPDANLGGLSASTSAATSAR
jgi:hypothetical protein